MKVDPFPELDTKHLVTLTPADKQDLAAGYAYLVSSVVESEQRNYRAVQELLAKLVPAEIERVLGRAKNVHE